MKWAGGRIPLIIGKGLTAKARAALGLAASAAFIAPEQPANNGKGYTKHKKMVEKLMVLKGIKPRYVC